MNDELRDRLRGVAVGAAVGDALGMPLEFGRAQPADKLVREMLPKRLPAGSFTDDTEMALALAESLLERYPLDPVVLASRFVDWYQSGPSDIGVHTSNVLSELSRGVDWRAPGATILRRYPDSAGNGSVMRCWPVALADWRDLPALTRASRLQSEVTHPHPECVAGCVYVNAAIYHLLHGASAQVAIERAIEEADLPEELRWTVEAAPRRSRDKLSNSGWVRHTLESATWGLLTTNSFEEAVVQVVNLGNDADTAGTVVGAMAGAAYGLSAIPPEWRRSLSGEWPIHSRNHWNETRFIALADRLALLAAPEERPAA